MSKKNLLFHPIISSIQRIALYETKAVSALFTFIKLVGISDVFFYLVLDTVTYM